MLLRGLVETHEVIPVAILKLPGAARVLGINAPTDGNMEPGPSALASTIIESAYQNQWRASDTRLGLPNPVTKGLLNKGLSKAKETLRERSNKKQENSIRSVGIKISTTIWK